MKKFLKLLVFLLLIATTVVSIKLTKLENENKTLITQNKELSADLEKLIKDLKESEQNLKESEISLESYKDAVGKIKNQSYALGEYKKTVEDLGSQLMKLENTFNSEYANPIIFKNLKENDWGYGMRVTYLNSQEDSPYVEFKGMTVVSGEFKILEAPENEQIVKPVVEFAPDEKSLKQLPMLEGYTGPMVIDFANYDQAAGILGSSGKTGIATVVIDDYTIDKSSSEKHNSARLIFVVDKKYMEILDDKPSKLPEEHPSDEEKIENSAE